MATGTQLVYALVCACMSRLVQLLITRWRALCALRQVELTPLPHSALRLMLLTLGFETDPLILKLLI